MEPSVQNEDTHTHSLCAGLPNRNARRHFTRAILHGNLQEKCRSPDGTQNADTRFVWERAVETHVNISQQPFYTADSGHTLCASLRSRNACNMSQEHTRAILHGNLQEKCRGPDGAQNADTHLFASLRGRNARQHFTGANLNGNLQEKCRGPAGAPWWSTGLYTYRKNSQSGHTVWGNGKKTDTFQLSWIKVQKTLWFQVVLSV